MKPPLVPDSFPAALFASAQPYAGESAADKFHPSADVLVVVVNDSEWFAAATFFDLQFRKTFETLEYTSGYFRYPSDADVKVKEKVTVIITRLSGAGSANAHTHVDTALRYIDCRFIVGIGCAFGLMVPTKRATDSLRRNMGDVLVSEYILSYESVREGEKRENRNQAIAVHPNLKKVMAQTCRRWKQFVYEHSSGGKAQMSCARYGIVLCGEKLIDKEEFVNATKELLHISEKGLFNGTPVVGGEMEGSGMIHAAQHHNDAPFLIIKGISDFAHDKDKEPPVTTSTTSSDTFTSTQSLSLSRSASSLSTSSDIDAMDDDDEAELDVKPRNQRRACYAALSFLAYTVKEMITLDSMKHFPQKNHSAVSSDAKPAHPTLEALSIDHKHYHAINDIVNLRNAADKGNRDYEAAVNAANQRHAVAVAHYTPEQSLSAKATSAQKSFQEKCAAWEIALENMKVYALQFEKERIDLENAKAALTSVNLEITAAQPIREAIAPPDPSLKTAYETAIGELQSKWDNMFFAKTLSIQVAGTEWTVALTETTNKVSWNGAKVKSVLNAEAYALVIQALQKPPKRHIAVELANSGRATRSKRRAKEAEDDGGHNEDDDDSKVSLPVKKQQKRGEK